MTAKTKEFIQTTISELKNYIKSSYNPFYGFTWDIYEFKINEFLKITELKNHVKAKFNPYDNFFQTIYYKAKVQQDYLMIELYERVSKIDLYSKEGRNEFEKVSELSYKALEISKIIDMHYTTVTLNFTLSLPFEGYVKEFCRGCGDLTPFTIKLKSLLQKSNTIIRDIFVIENKNTKATIADIWAYVDAFELSFNKRAVVSDNETVFIYRCELFMGLYENIITLYVEKNKRKKIPFFYKAPLNKRYNQCIFDLKNQKKRTFKVTKETDLYSINDKLTNTFEFLYMLDKYYLMYCENRIHIYKPNKKTDWDETESLTDATIQMGRFSDFLENVSYMRSKGYAQ